MKKTFFLQHRLRVKTGKAWLCCAETEQAVIIQDDDEHTTAVTAAAAAATNDDDDNVEPYISEDSEPMLVEPVVCTTTASQSTDTVVRPSSLSAEAEFLMPPSELPTNMNFYSCESSNHTLHISGSDDVASLSLRRPALYAVATLEAVDTAAHNQQDTVAAADADVKRSITEDDDNNDDVEDDLQSNHSDEMVSNHEVLLVHSGEYRSASVNDVRSVDRDAAAFADDERGSASSHDAATADAALTVGSDSTVQTTAVAVGSLDDNVSVSSDDDEVAVSAPVVDSDFDTAAVAMQTDAEVSKHGDGIDSSEPLNQPDVVGLMPGGFLSSETEQTEAEEVDASTCAPLCTAVVPTSAHVPSVDTVSPGRSALADQRMTSLITGAEDVHRPSMQPMDYQSKDFNRVPLDAADSDSDVLSANEVISQPAAATSDNAAVEQDVKADQKQQSHVTYRMEQASSASSVASTTGTFF